MTCVEPVLKNDPDVCDLEASVTVPELSVAMGSSHVTVVPPALSGMISVMSSTHCMISGGVPSTVEKGTHHVKVKFKVKLAID